MATKPKEKTPAQIQRDLEKKHGVIPCPFWFDFCSTGLSIDGEPVPQGTELVFEAADGTVCGAGVVFDDRSRMRMSPCYLDDSRNPAKTGAYFGEEVLIFDAATRQRLYYAPPVKHPGGYMRVILTELRTAMPTAAGEIGELYV